MVPLPPFPTTRPHRVLCPATHGTPTCAAAGADHVLQAAAFGGFNQHVPGEPLQSELRGDSLATSGGSGVQGGARRCKAVQGGARRCKAVGGRRMEQRKTNEAL